MVELAEMPQIGAYTQVLHFRGAIAFWWKIDNMKFPKFSNEYFHG
jgi:hypothetical protein